MLDRIKSILKSMLARINFNPKSMPPHLSDIGSAFSPNHHTAEFKPIKSEHFASDISFAIIHSINSNTN